MKVVKFHRKIVCQTFCPSCSKGGCRYPLRGWISILRMTKWVSVSYLLACDLYPLDSVTQG